MKQVILGAGGDMGRALYQALKPYAQQIRLVSRHPVPVEGNAQVFPADLRNASQTKQSLKGASIAYLVAGLDYDRRVWQRDWPMVMDHVIEACITQGTRLVFFDNVYMYAKEEISHMREDSRIAPPSAKGKVRALLIEKLQQAHTQKGLKYLIARSADFYGPGSRNGILNTLVLDPVSRGKRALWLSRLDRVHSFTYIPDAAKATALLGNTPSAYLQTWHLPTSREPWTGKDFIAYAKMLQKRRAGHLRLTKLLLLIAGVFNRRIFELAEMQYQNQREYFFDSGKFCTAFNFTPTSYHQGIQESLAAYTNTLQCDQAANS